ncbi:unnamed protein product [Rhizophagus irregularis]|nr:unnamed protein product [Rhizophagus irregularis]
MGCIIFIGQFNKFNQTNQTILITDAERPKRCGKNASGLFIRSRKPKNSISKVQEVEVVYSEPTDECAPLPLSYVAKIIDI